MTVCKKKKLKSNLSRVLHTRGIFRYRRLISEPVQETLVLVHSLRLWFAYKEEKVKEGKEEERPHSPRDMPIQIASACHYEHQGGNIRLIYL